MTRQPHDVEGQMDFFESIAGKSETARIEQIQNLLMSDSRTLLLRTTAEREADDGEYFRSYNIPNDEVKIYGIRPLTEKGQKGPTLINFTAEKKDSTAPVDELYFCPNGIDGNSKVIKVKDRTTAEQFIEQWNS